MKDGQADILNAFTGKSGLYSRRPEWPASAFDTVLQRTGLADQAGSLLVADIGAGTGRTAQPLLEKGCTVIATEPNAEMRRALEKLQQDFPARLIVTPGDAQNPQVPPDYSGQVRLVVSGNAGHWWGHHHPGNAADAEKTVAKAWRQFAHPDAQAAIMFYRMVEDDADVRALGDILERHFEKTRQSLFVPQIVEPFRPESFRDYFARAATGAMQESFVMAGFALRDYDHFKEWLLSYSCVPDDAFAHPEAATELQAFYDRLAEKGDGVALMPFGLRIYTGALAP